MDGALLALVGSIYDAVGEEDAVARIMGDISNHLGATGAYWYVVRKGATGNALRNPFLFDGALGFSDRALREFREEMWRHDYALGAAFVTNRTTETQDLLSEFEFERNDFVQWIRTSAGVDRRIGRSTDLTDNIVAGWALHMPTGLQRDEWERLQFDLLAPHVRNLFRLTSQFGEIATRDAVLEQVINSRQHAVFLLGGDGAICWASEAAMALCTANDGLVYRNGRLSFSRQADNQAFDALLHRATGSSMSAASDVMGRLTVARPSGSFPYMLELSPAPAQFRRHMHGRGAFILTVHDPDAHVDARPERWRDIFALTRMEAEVAALTMRGLSDATIADQLGIGIGTVRSHQKQLLAKTGTSSKAEVAHLLTRMN